jgi:general L-amino acid transport system substrate-binding protein
MNSRLLLGAVAAAALSAGAAAAQSTLDAVKARGVVNCGVSTGLAGFSFTKADGDWDGFDVAICRGLAAAIFADASKVAFTPLTSQVRFTTLASGEVDLLSRNSTWTVSRDTDLKFDWVGVNYYDGQGFMVPKALNVASAKELDGATVCIQTGTTTELNLADFFRANNMKYEPVPVADDKEAQQKYLANACDVYTTDASGLAAVRATFEKPGDHMLLPEIVSKEPLGPLVRHGDNAWGDIVRWTLNAMIIAEEHGITSANVKEIAADPNANPEVKRLLGVEGEFGAMLGLPKDWAVQVIAQAGSYDENFEKHLGASTPIGLERGLNALWSDGGILYAPPFR